MEFLIGKEFHSSSWSKFYVRGLEDITSLEENGRQDNHHYYNFYCIDPDVQTSKIEGCLFTVFIQEGDKHGTKRFQFYICEVDFQSEIQFIEAKQGEGYIEGHFKVLAEGVGKTKAPRLMGWWQQEQTKEFALACGEKIKVRGAKQPPVV